MSKFGAVNVSIVESPGRWSITSIVSSSSRSIVVTADGAMKRLPMLVKVLKLNVVPVRFPSMKTSFTRLVHPSNLVLIWSSLE